MAIAAAEMTWSEFLAEGKKRFGENRNEWRFVCVACGHVQSIADFMARHPGEKREDVANWLGQYLSGVSKAVPALTL